ncbi:hypothetical protein S7335_2543 [Synechococcus sp. PCC 7335]|uniref:DUF6714 family protein n=1 Tax=Synechococcus sp. (strain ATCC 29403 / PCC 7335) TaxID=91464 RepID=UPI00017EC794|nr:DUF6714 family protein [Synechococcus sp. PCC 7335]EDX84846.1 hypothetical protein S7335_2543 [Synechococcus sp. PCC 7335]
MAEAFYEQRKQALIQEITLAFEGVSREEGVTLHEATVLDDYGGPEERAKARAKDTEQSWQAVPERDIRFTDAVLSFLDDKGFRYYIPAYMIWYLRHIDDQAPIYRSTTFDSVVFHLTYFGKGGIPERFKLLTEAQGRAIAHFLLFESARYEALEKQLMQASLIKRGLSSEDIELVLQAQDFQDNQISSALDRYWQQFLPSA